MTIQEKLLFIRATKNYTQEKLGEKLLIRRDTICKLETGKYNASKVLQMKIDILYRKVKYEMEDRNSEV